MHYGGILGLDVTFPSLRAGCLQPRGIVEVCDSPADRPPTLPHPLSIKQASGNQSPGFSASQPARAHPPTRRPQHGEWLRLAAAPLLHLSDAHLYYNMLSTKHLAWAELFYVQLLAPAVSFAGRLAGIIAGLLHVHVTSPLLQKGLGARLQQQRQQQQEALHRRNPPQDS